MFSEVASHLYARIFSLLLILSGVRICISIKGSNYAALRGSSIRLSCIPSSVQIEGESDIGSTYTWTDQDKREVTDARFTKLASGELEIVNAHIGDSGVYTCKFRPPTTWDSKDTADKSFQHKLIVFEIAGHTFHSSAFFDLSMHTAEGTSTVLHEMMKSRVCGNDLCVPGTVKSIKCALIETGKQNCELELSYKGIEPTVDENCDEECAGEMMINGLKKAEKSLKSSLMAELKSPRGIIRPDMKTFDTKHLITCRAGFRLVKTHHKRCFPCFPGTYSKRSAVKCHSCAVGFYQEHFGKHQCEKCEEDKTTESVGAKSKEECVSSNTGILSNIKESIQSIFTG